MEFKPRFHVVHRILYCRHFESAHMLGDVVTEHHNTGNDKLSKVLLSERYPELASHVCTRLHLIGCYGLNGDPSPEILLSHSTLLLYRGLSYCEKRMPKN